MESALRTRRTAQGWQPPRRWRGRSVCRRCRRRSLLRLLVGNSRSNKFDEFVKVGSKNSLQLFLDVRTTCLKFAIELIELTFESYLAIFFDCLNAFAFSRVPNIERTLQNLLMTRHSQSAK